MIKNSTMLGVVLLSLFGCGGFALAGGSGQGTKVDKGGYDANQIQQQAEAYATLLAALAQLAAAQAALANAEAAKAAADAAVPVALQQLNNVINNPPTPDMLVRLTGVLPPGNYNGYSANAFALPPGHEGLGTGAGLLPPGARIDVYGLSPQELQNLVAQQMWAKDQLQRIQNYPFRNLSPEAQEEAFNKGYAWINPETGQADWDTTKIYAILANYNSVIDAYQTKGSPPPEDDTQYLNAIGAAKAQYIAAQNAAQTAAANLQAAQAAVQAAESAVQQAQAASDAAAGQGSDNNQPGG